MSVGRQEAFEIFKRDYEQNVTIEEQKVDLKQRYAEAKGLGKEVNESRQRISTIFFVNSFLFPKQRIRAVSALKVLCYVYKSLVCLVTSSN